MHGFEVGQKKIIMKSLFCPLEFLKVNKMTTDIVKFLEIKSQP